MTWFLEALKKYAVFNGRARRKEYWMYMLFYTIIAAGITIFEGAIGAYGLISLLGSLFFFLPSLSVTIRRLHDINKSGFWFFISLIPLIGPIWLLILVCQEGTSGPNCFGDDPTQLA